MNPVNKIRRARHAAGLTQEQLARACQCGVRNVPAWESGQRKPRTVMLQRIANACNVSVGDLIEEEATSEVVMPSIADILTAALEVVLRDAKSENDAKWAVRAAVAEWDGIERRQRVLASAT